MQSLNHLPSPNRQLSNFSVVVIKDKMYILGYYMNKSTKRSALEWYFSNLTYLKIETDINLLYVFNSYNPDDRKWKSLPTMSTLRLNFGAVCLQNQLFVAYKENSKSVICNRFDPATNQWSKMNSLEFDKTTHGAVLALAMKDELQVLISTPSEIKVYRYDDKTEKWIQVNNTFHNK